MQIPQNIIVNADDIGLNPSVNRAILFCFKEGLINSTSLLTNMDYFEHAVEMIHQNPEIRNVGVHGNFAEGNPLTDFKAKQFLQADGKWDITKTNKVLLLLSLDSKKAFIDELDAQIERALAANIDINHLDAHLHLHTLPAFIDIFIKAAKKHRLKLRLAQTYDEGSLIKFTYRKYINSKIAGDGLNYSIHFETVDEFLKHPKRNFKHPGVEIMVHPDFRNDGTLYDHVDGTSMDRWLGYLQSNQ